MTNEETVQNTYSVDLDSFSDGTIRIIELTQDIETFKVYNIVNDTVIRLEGQDVRIFSRSRSISINIHIKRITTFKFELKPSIKIEFLGRFMSTLLLKSLFLFNCEGDTIFNIPATPWMNSTANVVIDSYGFLTVHTNCSNLPISIFQMIHKELNIYFSSRNLNINGDIDTTADVNFHCNLPDSKLYIKTVLFYKSFLTIGGNVQNIFIKTYKSGANLVHAPTKSLKINKYHISERSQLIAHEINIHELKIDWYGLNVTHPYLSSDNLHIETINFQVQNKDNFSSVYIPLAKTKNEKIISEIKVQQITAGYYFVKHQLAYNQSTQTIDMSLERQNYYYYRKVVITENPNPDLTGSCVFSLKELYKMPDVLSFSDNRLDIEIQDKYSEPVVFENLSSYSDSIEISADHTVNIIILGEYPKYQIEIKNVNLLSNSTKLIDLSILIIAHSKLVGNFTIICDRLKLTFAPEFYQYNVTAKILDVNYESDYTIISKSHLEFLNCFMNIEKISEIIILRRKGEGNITQIDIPTAIIELNGINNIQEFSKFKNLNISNGNTSISNNVSVSQLYTYGKVLKLSSNTFDEDMNVTIYSGIIESSVPKTFKIKNLSVVNTDLSLTNVTFVPENFVISGSSDNYEHNISCRSIVINQDSHASLNSLNDFCDIIFNYSIYQTGYLFVHNITQSSECNVTAHFINNDIRDQVFYNDVWDNFSIDVLCSDIFNVHYIDAIFSSFHWNFNSSTSYFDMSIQNKSSQTCISIVRRTDTPENSDKHSSKNIKNIIIISVCLFIGLSIIIIFTIILVLRHRKLHDIERFMSDTPSATLL
ncbi:hypothetical protein TVAG_114780 [Trichomonas vaginalis G3]|uniref:Surface antigen BspA-like n=1 Tax=Trichomonas vaginalis (strain ATCC PRA-98 / G3) TaxID=412133 RepID=A2FGK1_TRIV3|nr:hypothetical protein TVAGG3_0037140 [Trichomonas vaginalis G3]EAX95967.1 hypothetical protein TVAG_114780 [Trichomonas vaginalis G3]KAI5540465.1 hypothetical protein TVAGG3_0037140 [Trichomonas vaginalis G3]|eukprot:XP_001308897.1 hypothetical protein [Trichomonas vaginalis G3]